MSIQSNKKPICKKGIGKAHGFPGCGSETYKLHYGLCPACEYDWLTQTEVGKIEFEKRKSYLKVKKVKEEKKENRIHKEKLKTLSQLENEAKVVFQKWIRLRDAGKPCISCGKYPKDPAGGHYYSAGTYSGLIFNPNNCHLQCNTNCNKHLSGNLLEYRKGLINRFGIEFVENLDKLSIELRDYKYDRQELIDIKNKYLTKIKNNDFTVI